MRYGLAGAMLVVASAAVHAATNATPNAHAPAPAAAHRENLNCNDPAVLSGPGSWKPTKVQLQSFDAKLAKVFPLVATKAGIPKANYGVLHCGIHEGTTAVIVVNGVNKLKGKYICDDESNFAVAFDPAAKSFGTFHFAANLCRPAPPGAPKPK